MLATTVPGSVRFPWRRKWQPTPEFLSGETPWTEEPGQDYSPVGLQKVRYNLATKTRTTNYGGEG